MNFKHSNLKFKAKCNCNLSRLYAVCPLLELETTRENAVHIVVEMERARKTSGRTAVELKNTHKICSVFSSKTRANTAHLLYHGAVELEHYTRKPERPPPLPVLPTK